jgi:hypothetical protein
VQVDLTLLLLFLHLLSSLKRFCLAVSVWRLALN